MSRIDIFWDKDDITNGRIAITAPSIKKTVYVDLQNKSIYQAAKEYRAFAGRDCKADIHLKLEYGWGLAGHIH